MPKALFCITIVNTWRACFNRYIFKLITFTRLNWRSDKLKVSEIADKINQLASVVVDLKESGSLTEEETKRKLIEPFFQCFGWDFSEYGDIDIKMEYKTNNELDKDKADYCFKIQDESFLIVEAKQLGITFTENDRKQLQRYLKLDDCRYGALTNGKDYEFYLKKGREYEIFHKIHLSNGKAIQKADIYKIAWLDRELWDMWLFLHVEEFEDFIAKFCDVDRESEKEQIESEPPEQEMEEDYSQKPPKGESITVKEYFEPILELLGEKNGIGGREIIIEIGKKFSKKFNKWDRAKIPSGDIRWENHVWCAFEGLKKEGKIKLEDHKYYLEGR